MKNYDFAILGATSTVSQVLIPYIAAHKHYKNKKILLIYRNNPESIKKWQKQKSILSLDARFDEEQWDGTDVKVLNSILCKTKILINMAGPYYPRAIPVIETCLATQTHYLDLTGEVLLPKEIKLRFEEKARELGVNLVPCAGFDSLPSDFLSFLLAKEIFEKDDCPQKLQLVFRVKGQVNGGSFQSALGIFGLTSITDLQNSGLYTGENVPAPLTALTKINNKTYATFFMEFINRKIVRKTLVNLSKKYHQTLPKDFIYNELIGYGPIAYLSHSFNQILIKTLKNETGRMLAKKFGPKSGAGPNHYSIYHGRVNINAFIEGKNQKASATLESEGDPGNLVTSKCLALASYLTSIDETPGGFKTVSQLCKDNHISYASEFGIDIAIH